MFEIVEKRGQTYINLTRNDSCEILTCLFIDADENKIFSTDNNDKPLNLYGQICLENSVYWYFLSGVGIVLDDFIRWKFFGEDKPHYRWI